MIPSHIINKYSSVLSVRLSLLVLLLLKFKSYIRKKKSCTVVYVLYVHKNIQNDKKTNRIILQKTARK